MRSDIREYLVVQRVIVLQAVTRDARHHLAYAGMGRGVARGYPLVQRLGVNQTGGSGRVRASPPE